MKGFRLSVSLIITALLLVNCAGGGGPVAPGDYMPPVWDTTTGVTSVVPGENQVTVIWGTATDAMTPPVEYLLYIDEDDDPWDQSPVLKPTNDPHVFANLDNGIEYWCGVRSRDSADPPNVEKNDLVMSATPEEGQVTPDTTPPVWDDTVGVITVVPGEGSVTVEWGTAADAESPPVEYLVYVDEDDEPWDQEPMVFTTNDPYTFTDLFSNIDYHFGVRCRDSADIPNSDSNENFLVSETIPRGWTLDWGYGNYDIYSHTKVQIDSMGNIYIMGYKQGPADFDPGEGYTGNSGTVFDDVYLLKLNSDGEFQWAKQWWGHEFSPANKYGFCLDSQDYIYLGVRYSSENHFQKIDGEGNSLWDHETDIGFRGIIIDENDDLYIAGRFSENTDFDPGDGVDIRTSNGESDIYLSKFDSSGSFKWVRTWGGEGFEFLGEIATDFNGDIYIFGEFYESLDFDPGPGTDYHTSNGSWDAFLSSFDMDGTFRWARTWGGSESDGAHRVIANSSGMVYAAGSFQGIVDFDPSIGEDIHTAIAGYDSNLSCFDSSGSYYYVYTSDNLGIRPGFDDMNNLICAGTFIGDVDLDFTEGENIFLNDESHDSYLSKYDPTGNYLWSIVWGGNDGGVEGNDLAFDNQGNMYVVGIFWGVDCDFDPGPGVENIISGGSSVLYLSKFPPDGYW
ncbi:hypothetical protein KAU08_02595 [bacterium]|nr:hypothetical protein [bacterium]